MAAIVQTKDLAKDFAGYRAIDGVTIAIEEGSIHAIIGPNGAGKTTFFNLLSGLAKPTQRNGLSARHRHHGTSGGEHRAHGDDPLVPDQLDLSAPHRSGKRESLRSKRSRIFPRSSGRALRRRDTSTDPRGELLAQVGLRGHDESPAVQLPYGRKRQLELAITLAQDPQLLLAGRADRGHDDRGRRPRDKLIGRVAKGRTVVLVEHNLSVVADLCDRITVLQRGQSAGGRDVCRGARR